MTLAARVVREVKLHNDSDGLNLARMAIIITGLSLNTNGAWEGHQLTPPLQRSALKLRTVFDAFRAISVDRNWFWVEIWSHSNFIVSNIVATFFYNVPKLLSPQK